MGPLGKFIWVSKMARQAVWMKTRMSMIWMKTSVSMTSDLSMLT